MKRSIPLLYVSVPNQVMKVIVNAADDLEVNRHLEVLPGKSKGWSDMIMERRAAAKLASLFAGYVAPDFVVARAHQLLMAAIREAR